MVNSINNQNINIKLKGTNVTLNKNNVKATQITKDTPLFMKKYDANNDGIISEKEARKMLSDLQKAAGNNTLSEKEFEKAKLGTKEDFNKIGTSVDKKAGKTTVKNKDGSVTTTTRNEDGSFSTVTTNEKKKFTETNNYDTNGNLIGKQTKNPNGSTTARYAYDKNGNMVALQDVNKDSKGAIINRYETKYSYDNAGNKTGILDTKYDAKGQPVSVAIIHIQNNSEGKPIQTTRTVTDSKTGKTTRQDITKNEYQNGKLTTSKTQSTTPEYTSISNKKYADDGKTLSGVTEDVNNKDGSTAHNEYKINKYGKNESSHSVIKDSTGKTISDLTKKCTYEADGKTIKQFEVSGTQNGNPITQVDKFKDGKIESSHLVTYRRGGKVEEYYDGPNLKNKLGEIPTKQIKYEKDGKTVKEITENTFDKDGVLTGMVVKDKDGKVTQTHDFSKVDGNFDTSFQKGRGDCYLLSGLNSLRESSEGREALKQTITTGKNEKGETTYTVHFPGAKEARERLLKQGVPEKNIDIKESYTYTESEIHEKAKLAGKKYSAGDKDVLLLEVAYENYRTDAYNDMADLKKANPKLNDAQAQKQLYIRGVLTNDADKLNSGHSGDAVALLTGKESEIFLAKCKKEDVPICQIDSDLNMKPTGHGIKLSPEQNKKMDNMLDKMANDCKDGKLDNYAGNAGMLVGSQNVNGKELKGGGHAFSISKVDDKNVYLRNPWDPTKEIVMSREDFKKTAYELELTPLNGKTGSVSNENGNSNVNNTNIPQAGGKYKVPKGKGYKTLLAEALRQQGIDPTPENIKKASEQFKASNKKETVRTYDKNGPIAKFRGNEYLIKDAVVIIPKFKIDDEEQQ